MLAIWDEESAILQFLILLSRLFKNKFEVSLIYLVYRILSKSFKHLIIHLLKFGILVFKLLNNSQINKINL